MYVKAGYGGGRVRWGYGGDEKPIAGRSSLQTIRSTRLTVYGMWRSTYCSKAANNRPVPAPPYLPLRRTCHQWLFLYWQLQHVAICVLQAKVICWCQTVSFSPRSFAVTGPSTWNSLPTALKDPLLTVGQFCNRLKTEVFIRSYYIH